MSCASTTADASKPRSNDLSDAATVLAANAWDWAYQLRSVALIEGTLRIPERALEAVEHAALDQAAQGGGGSEDRYWRLRFQLAGQTCTLGDLPPQVYCDVFLRPESRRTSIAQLRRSIDHRVWFGVTADGGMTTKLPHLAEDTEREAAAFRVLLQTPIERLAEGVARRSPRVDQLVAHWVTERISAFDACRQAEALDEHELPGLLHAMLHSLRSHHANEVLAEPRVAVIDGYNMPVRCVFDVLCVTSQNLRGFLYGTSADERAREAEVRALAVWLHFRARGTPAAQRCLRTWE